MANYQTRPLKQLLDFFAAHPEQSYTVDELTAGLAVQYQEDAPGKSTVYRLISRLEKEQKIKRFEKEGSHCAYYQITACTHNHLHLKCTGCGKLFHMKETASEHLLQDVLNNAGFSVDQQQTVLFGKCAGCKERES
ncbi:MAG: transcriptional repressor [Clostridia bacterium]|nr:transcriptional repressor [Clostridia bacterium]